MGLHRFLPGWWDKDLNPLEPNACGLDQLTIAARLGHTSICKDLIHRNFNLNREVESPSQSALGTAIETGNIDLTTVLLAHGADPDLATKNRSLLCLATENGLESLEAMLAARANPKIHCGGECEWGCALSMAAWRGDIDEVEALIGAGADLNPTFASPGRRSPLMHSVGSWRRTAFRYRHRDPQGYHCTRLLLEHGADSNAPIESRMFDEKFGSLLEVAVAADDLDLARLLVENGANVGVPMELQGYDTILEYAVEKGHVDFARLLISHGADAHCHMKIGKYGSILAAATFAPESTLQMVKYLIEEAHVNLEHLRWQLSPPMQDRISRTSSLTYSSSSSTATAKTRERTRQKEISMAERAEYLINEHQVDSQVLKDISIKLNLESGSYPHRRISGSSSDWS